MGYWKSLISMPPRVIREHRTNRIIGKAKIFLTYNTLTHTKKANMLLFDNTGNLTGYVPYSLQGMKETIAYLDMYSPVFLHSDRKHLWINKATHQKLLENRKLFKAKQHEKYLEQIRARYDRAKQ